MTKAKLIQTDPLRDRNSVPTAYEYVVVTLQAGPTVTSDLEGSLTKKLNSVASHGWELQGQPMFELGPVGVYNKWVMTFRREKVEDLA